MGGIAFREAPPHFLLHATQFPTSGRRGWSCPTAVQINDRSRRFMGLGPAGVRKGSAFPADSRLSLPLRPAVKAIPSAARRRLVISPEQRKGTAFHPASGGAAGCFQLTES